MLEVLENNRYSVTPRADADTKRFGPALTAVTGGLLSIGGMDWGTKTWFSSVSYYELTSDNASACVHKGMVYVFCGTTTGG